MRNFKHTVTCSSQMLIKRFSLKRFTWFTRLLKNCTRKNYEPIPNAGAISDIRGMLDTRSAHVWSSSRKLGWLSRVGDTTRASALELSGHNYVAAFLFKLETRSSELRFGRDLPTRYDCIAVPTAILYYHAWSWWTHNNKSNRMAGVRRDVTSRNGVLQSVTHHTLHPTCT